MDFGTVLFGSIILHNPLVGSKNRLLKQMNGVDIAGRQLHDCNEIKIKVISELDAETFEEDPFLFVLISNRPRQANERH